MQSEETFRDLKSHRRELALRYARTERPERLEVLLLIAALAMLALWLVGIAAKSLGWTARFQANTIRHRDVLSTVFLARAVLKTQPLRLPSSSPVAALRQLKTMLNADLQLA